MDNVVIKFAHCAYKREKTSFGDTNDAWKLGTGTKKWTHHPLRSNSPTALQISVKTKQQELSSYLKA